MESTISELLIPGLGSILLEPAGKPREKRQNKQLHNSGSKIHWIYNIIFKHIHPLFKPTCQIKPNSDSDILYTYTHKQYPLHSILFITKLVFILRSLHVSHVCGGVAMVTWSLGLLPPSELTGVEVHLYILTDYDDVWWPEWICIMILMKS